jgi:hypothetical protein
MHIYVYSNIASHVVMFLEVAVICLNVCICCFYVHVNWNGQFYETSHAEGLTWYAPEHVDSGKRKMKIAQIMGGSSINF